MRREGHYHLSPNLFGQDGSSIIEAIAILLLVGYIGAETMEHVSVSASAGANDTSAIRALHIGNGGLQYALAQLNMGENPEVDGKSFASGNFSVVTDSVANEVEVTGYYGLARRVQKITTDFCDDVMDLDVTGAEVQGKSLKNMELVKDGHAMSVLSGVIVNWNTSVCAQDLICDTDVSGKVDICHYPPGGGAGKTLSVGTSAANTHVAHGDTLGNCPGDSVGADSQIACEGFETEIASCSASDGNALLDRVEINGVTLANNANVPVGQLIDFTDQNYTEDKAYPLNEIQFSRNLPDGTWYSITFTCKDGSQRTTSFKLGS